MSVYEQATEQMLIPMFGTQPPLIESPTRRSSKLLVADMPIKREGSRVPISLDQLESKVAILE